MATSDCSNSINQQPSTTSQPEQHPDTPQPDYHFVDQPDQDYFCPVSLELLTQPHQTTCCGNHISQQAANTLIREGKPCPLCMKNNFATHEDLYFKRNSVHKLNIYCSHKKSGCEWTGELGDMNQHTTFCPKRPWNCPYCQFQSTHDIGTTDHAPQCNYRPVPCPNHCEVGTVHRCHAEKHLLYCPLQLVDCEFASAGCDVRVPRKDLAGHVTESAQHHLMTATLLNLRLTRELHQKIEENDQQIVQLQTQLQQLDTKVDTKFQKLDDIVNTKFQKLNDEVETKFQKVDTKFQQLNEKVDTETSEVKTAVEANKVALHNDLLLLLRGFTCHEITLTKFTQWQAKGSGVWESTHFSNTPNGHSFKLLVFTNGWDSTRGTHLSVLLYKQHIISETEGTVVIHLLNQLGIHGHYIEVEKQISTEEVISFGSELRFFPLADLGYCADSNTQYLKDNCLKFRLFLKVKVL